MNRTCIALTSLALGAAFQIGCVVHQNPPVKSADPAPAPAPAPAPTGTTEPAPAPVDMNAEIPADPADPASITAALPAQQTLELPPGTPGLAEQLAPGVAEGMPTGIESASPAAYWIWRTPDGIWKVRTTTAKLPHQFRGRVKGVRAPIGATRPSRPELANQVAKGTGSEVYFNFATNGHVEGFDFRVSGCARFDLHLDGGAAPKKVFVGKGVASPTSNHFILCPPQ